MAAGTTLPFQFLFQKGPFPTNVTIYRLKAILHAVGLTFGCDLVLTNEVLVGIGQFLLVLLVLDFFGHLGP